MTDRPSSGQMPDFLITLPPPTPNGGLHVGHMAGPFLAADVFAKARIANGETVHVLSYSDTNQSYVRVTAEKQNRDPAELASAWTRDILETLEGFGCTVDDYFEPDPASNGFVRDTIVSLYKKGRLKRKHFTFFYSAQAGGFLDEAGVSGNCSECLDDCKCGICEACGYINSAESLLNPYATNNPEWPLELRPVPVMVLELEAWREELRRFHRFPDAIRPKYRWLIDDALSKPLPDFPITVPASWGIAVDHPDFAGQVINAWPEIALDFVYGYQKASGTGGVAPRIVNFFGYDNSYFYAFVHVALLHAMKAPHYLPHATVINEFYNLDNAKFSTSRGHLIWASDIITTLPADLVRFYLALSAPGFEQGNFNEQEMRDVVDRRLAQPFREIASRLNHMASPEVSKCEPSQSAVEAGRIMKSRIARNLTLERFNLRHAAEDSLRALHYIERVLPAAQDDTTRQHVADSLHLMACWADAIGPLMPKLSTRLPSRLTQMCLERRPLDPGIAALAMDQHTEPDRELENA